MFRCVRTVTVILRRVRWRLLLRSLVMVCSGMQRALPVHAARSCSSTSATAAKMATSTVSGTMRN